MPQLPALTALRGLAALLVALFHFSGDALPDLPALLRSSVVTRGFLWVDLFFLLSGFVLAHVYGDAFRPGCAGRDYRGFVVARAARIWPLHLVTLAALVGLEAAKLLLRDARGIALAAEPFSGARSPEALLLNLLMLQGAEILPALSWNGPAWSVGAEWLCYLALPALVVALRRAAGAAWLLAAAASAGLWWLSDGGRTLDLTVPGGLARCAGGVALGCALHALFASRRGAGWLGGDAAAAAALLLCFALLALPVPDLALLPAFALLVLALAHGRGRLGRWLHAPAAQFAGRISFAAYLVHLVLLESLDFGWYVATGSGFGRGFGPVSSLLALLGLLLGTAALASALHLWVEEPARRAIRRAASPPGAGPAPGG